MAVEKIPHSDRAIDLNATRIMNIANGSDEALKLFEETPIRDILYQRRIIARKYMDTRSRQAREMLEMCDREIAIFFQLM
jgi:hypothetical protein